MKRYDFTVPCYFYEDDPYPYDHPTKISKLEEHETITRLIDSIRINLPKTASARVFLILGFTPERKLNIPKIEKKLAGIISKKTHKNKKIEIFIINSKFLDQSALIAKKYNIEISNISYGNVRNLQLILQVVRAHKYQINLDDDEVIMNREFYEKVDTAVKFLGKSINTVGAGGFYVNKQGTVDIPQAGKKGKDFIEDKDRVMQIGFDQYKKRVLTKSASLVLGGLSITSLELAKNVCYDPWIIRGEDLDYVINAHFKELDFAFFRDLKILHLPPVQNVESYITPRISNKGRDTLRFIYEKLKIMRFCENDHEKLEKFLKMIGPYPGILLKSSVSDMMVAGAKYVDPRELELNVTYENPRQLEKYFTMLHLWSEFSLDLFEDKRAFSRSFIRI